MTRTPRPTATPRPTSTARPAPTVLALAAPRIAVSPIVAAIGAVVTVRGTGFAAYEQVTLSLNGAALDTTPAVIQTASDGTFTAAFHVPGGLLSGSNTLGAIGDRTRSAVVATLEGVVAVAARYYFAGGMETRNEHAALALLNAGAGTATVHVTLYFASGASATRLLTVPATSQVTVPVTRLMRRRGAFGLALTADRPLTAALNLTRAGRDGDTILGNTGLARRWYLAEGYTGLSFHETVAVLNPSIGASARVRLRLLPLGGHARRTVDVIAPPHSDVVLNINRLMPARSLSIVAEADHPVVVERTLTFSRDAARGLGALHQGYGMTTRAGINVAATSWLFAEGTTVKHFQTFLTVLNPGNRTARVMARFYGRDGHRLGAHALLVAPRSRATLKLNDILSADAIASSVTGDMPVVVERPEYFGSPNGVRVAGGDVFGRNGAAVRWSFPGCAGAGDDEFLLLYNPSPFVVPVAVEVYGGAGRPAPRRVTIPPSARYTVDLRRLFPDVGTPHGVTVRSTDGRGFLAEQTAFAPSDGTLQSTEGLAQ